VVGSEEQVDSRCAGYELRQQLETEHYGKSVEITIDEVSQTFGITLLALTQTHPITCAMSCTFTSSYSPSTTYKYIFTHTTHSPKHCNSPRRPCHHIRQPHAHNTLRMASSLSSSPAPQTHASFARRSIPKNLRCSPSSSQSADTSSVANALHHGLTAVRRMRIHARWTAGSFSALITGKVRRRETQALCEEQMRLLRRL